MAAAWLAGVLVGAAYFGALWFSVRGLISTPTAWAWWLPLTLVARVVLACLALYLLTGGDAQRLLIALLGLLTARALWRRYVEAAQ